MKASTVRPALVCAGCGCRIVVAEGVTVGHYPTPALPADDRREDWPLCPGSFYPPVERAQ